MDASGLVDRLERGAQALSGLFDGVGSEQAGWKPAADHWSILEVAAHLLDEEREDFRVRIRSTLEAPLHQRQLARLHYGWIRRLGGPYSPAYAGDW
jgi:hypothetical protein